MTKSSGFAEYTITKAESIAPKPVSLDFGHAAAKTLAGEGARVIVHGRRQVEAGQVVREIEAAGGTDALAVGDLASDDLQ